MECRFCEGPCIKKGIKNGSQTYRCVQCLKYQKRNYRNRSYLISDELIIQCVKEGLGIRNMARLLQISAGTVSRRIRAIATTIVKPPIPMQKSFEVDELFTFIGRKRRQVCVVVAIEKESGFPVDFYVGPRTKRSLRMVTNTLLASFPKSIYTDRLSLYQGLLPPVSHKTLRYGTNKVERFNLSLRTHLKRLNRRSIAFSKSITMLHCCLRIYFWS